MRIYVTQERKGGFNLVLDQMTLALDQEQTRQLHHALSEALEEQERRRSATERYLATSFDRLVDLDTRELAGILAELDLNAVTVITKLAAWNLPFTARLKEAMSTQQREKIIGTLTHRFLDGVPEAIAEETMMQLHDVVEKLKKKGRLNSLK